MNKEEFLKAIENVPKIDNINPISAYNSINVEDLANAIERFKKVPTYNELLKENKQLKNNWNYIKKILKEARQEKYINGYCGTCTDVDIDFLLGKMQEIMGGDK